MPQGLSAGPQRPTRPGPAAGQQIGDWRRASAPTSARPRKRPVQRGQFSQFGTAPLEPQQHGEQLVVSEPGPPRSQRRHERAGRSQQDSSTAPQNWPFCASRGSSDPPLQARRIRRSVIVQANYNVPARHATRPREALTEPDATHLDWIAVGDVTCRLQDGPSYIEIIIVGQIAQTSSPAFWLISGLHARFSNRAAVCRVMPFRPCYPCVDLLRRPGLCCYCVAGRRPGNCRRALHLLGTP